MYKNNNKAFTLVELMIVIAVIGILAVVLVPKMAGTKDSAKQAGVQVNMKTAHAIVESIITNYDNSATSMNNFKAAIIAKFTGANGTIITNPFNGKQTALDYQVAASPTTTAAIKVNYLTGAVTPLCDATTNAAQDTYWGLGGTVGTVLGNSGTVIVSLWSDSSGVVKSCIYGFDKGGTPFTPLTGELQSTN